jgi:hypothetical protein
MIGTVRNVITKILQGETNAIDASRPNQSTADLAIALNHHRAISKRNLRKTAV